MTMISKNRLIGLICCLSVVIVKCAEKKSDQDDTDTASETGEDTDTGGDTDSDSADTDTATDSSPSYYFEDGFESGDILSTNPQGFAWAGDNGNAVFGPLGMIWKSGEPIDPPVSSYDSGTGWAWAQDENSLWIAKNGVNFLNFIYTPDKTWCERRFDLGVSLPDIWIRYWIRIPTNFSFPIDGECGESSAGNKFFALWQDGYSSWGQGATFMVGYTSYDSSNNATLSTNWSPGCGVGVGSQLAPPPCDVEPKPSKELWLTIRSPEDQGRWMQLVYHVRASSAVGVADGLTEIYHRWDGEPAFTQKVYRPDIYMHNVDGGWRAGYILGDTGKYYCEQTEWLLDDFTVSDQPLL